MTVTQAQELSFLAKHVLHLLIFAESDVTFTVTFRKWIRLFQSGTDADDSDKSNEMRRHGRH